MIACEKCLNNEYNSKIQINGDKICQQCKDHQVFSPLDDAYLNSLFEKTKAKNKKYDALVPLSGGKDSTYVLYLALKKYGLNVLTYTFDNAFMSDLAKENVRRSIDIAKVDHVWYKIPDDEIYKLYRRALTVSGELCGVCGVAIERSMLEISERYKIPLILLGHSPAEDESFTKEQIYDPHRLKAILKSPDIKDEEIDKVLIYPKLNYISSFAYTKLGKFGKRINLLYFQEFKSDQEIAELIKKELNWKDADHSSYTRHLDCLAEPFTNYIRDHRLGNSRRLPQINSMIRNGEISRKDGEAIFMSDQERVLPVNYDLVKTKLNLKDSDIKGVFEIPIGIYSNKEAFANKVFAGIRKLVKSS